MFENDWTVLDQDPYYTPKTEEELEESGTNVASLGNNIARKYMDQVRRRKVLFLLAILSLFTYCFNRVWRWKRN